jgi:hypothetical protein
MAKPPTSFSVVNMQSFSHSCGFCRFAPRPAARE